MKVKDIVGQYDIENECNQIKFTNEYNKDVFVELHSIHDEAVWLDGEFTEKDLIALAKALKKINST